MAPEKKPLKEFLKQIVVHEKWRENYKNHVPKFIEEAKKGLSYDAWAPDIFFEFFEKSKNHSVAGLGQGNFDNTDKSQIKENWDRISPLLKEIANTTDQPPLGLYSELKEIILSCTRSKKRSATNRLIAAIQPQFLCTVINHDKLNELISYLNTYVLNADLKPKDDWFESSYEVHDFIRREGEFTDAYEMATYPWQLFELFSANTPVNNNQMKNTDKLKEYKDLLEYKKQIILQGPPGTGKTKMAKELALQLIGGDLTADELEQSEQFKLIQFHPGYSYEDFVRGIVAKPNPDGDGIIYEAENKTLAIFAEKAKMALRPNLVFDEFVEHITEKIRNSDIEKYPITDSVYLFNPDETRFKYKGDNWNVNSYGLSMKFSELKKMIEARVKDRQDIVKMNSLERLSKEHATYFWKVIEEYYDFEKKRKPSNIDESAESVKNFVLVIDEINRANLSSVLGELIYALEYRGKEVDTLYKVGEDSKLSLPPNLYIIGTMNTADRSVGHIDYAIRRRFAFANVGSKDLTDSLGTSFFSDLYKKVAKLFDDHVSQEFEIEDVKLGHSYFIDKGENGNIHVRFKYEIKPILLEYVKDGILKGEDIIEKIENLLPTANGDTSK